MMTTSLRALTDRADLADTIINNLRRQVVFLHNAYAEKAADKSRGENEKLRGDVERLKTELCLAEIKNGVRQYYVPVNISTVMSPNKPDSQASSVSPPQQQHESGDKLPEKSTEKAQSKSAANLKKSAKKAKTCTTDEERLDVSRLDMRVGRIVGVERHPDADTLYVEQVDVGEGETRTVVSGLVKHISMQEMENRLAVFMCNLKPAKVRGVLSQAMIMCATSTDKSKVEILDPPRASVVGDKISVQKYPGTPDVQLNPKKKIWEQVKPDLLTNGEAVATYKGEQFVVAGKGNIAAQTVAHGQIS